MQTASDPSSPVCRSTYTAEFGLRDDANNVYFRDAVELTKLSRYWHSGGGYAQVFPSTK